MVLLQRSERRTQRLLNFKIFPLNQYILSKTTYGLSVFIRSGKAFALTLLLLGILMFIGAESIKLSMYDDLMAYPTLSAILLSKPALVIPIRLPVLSSNNSSLKMDQIIQN